jgi:hypothetical protein
MDLPVGSDCDPYTYDPLGRCALMRYLKIVMLLLAVTVGTEACIIIPVPIGGGGGGHHHHRHDW